VTVVLAVKLAAACGPKKNVIPANISQPDRYLLDKADEAIKKKRWSDAREYYRQVVDNYPQSPIRPDAKLGMGETYLGEGSSEALVMGANEFREFLTFYPTNAKADLAQFHLALCHQKQMRAAERDQTETKDALKEYQVFFDRYPNSPLMPEVRAKWREARDRLSMASYRVGITYYRQRWYTGGSTVSGKCSKTIRNSRARTASTSTWPIRCSRPTRRPIRRTAKRWRSRTSSACCPNLHRASTPRTPRSVCRH
jgi:outer membrane assembly lipoprotein YfiO